MVPKSHPCWSRNRPWIKGYSRNGALHHNLKQRGIKGHKGEWHIASQRARHSRDSFGYKTLRVSHPNFTTLRYVKPLLGTSYLAHSVGPLDLLQGALKLKIPRRIKYVTKQIGRRYFFKYQLPTQLHPRLRPGELLRFYSFLIFGSYNITHYISIYENASYSTSRFIHGQFHMRLPYS